MSHPSLSRCQDDLVQWLSKLFDAEAAGDLHAVVHFEVIDDATRSVVLRVDDGRLDVAEGGATDPDLRLRASNADFVAALSGVENVDVMHMQGRVEVEGDLGIAMKMRCVFPPAC